MERKLSESSLNTRGSASVTGGLSPFITTAGNVLVNVGELLLFLGLAWLVIILGCVLTS
ncbi:MAG: hypothetical protein ACXAEU_20225 [Candidatus Hodarchaeales archaeon]